jgi:hypothetical protein
MTEPVPYDTLFPDAQVFEIGEHILAMDQQGQFWSYRPTGKQLQRVSAPGIEEICRRGQADPQGFRIIWNKGQESPILLCGSTA